MKKILIIEDEIIIGLDISSKLKRHGFKVTGEASSPEEAMDSILQEEPELIIMDINLKSEKDGIDLAADINKKHKIPIIFLTSYSDKSTLSRAMDTEPYGYVIKPYTIETLIATINTAFTRVELEKNIKKQSLFYDSIINSTSEGILFIDNEGDVILANESFSKMIENDNVLGKNIKEITAGQLDCQFIKLVNNSSGSTMLNFNTKSDQKRLYMSLSDYKSADYQEGIIITFTDLTEMESVKDALIKAEGRFSKIFRKNTIPSALVTCPESRIYEVNEAFEDLYEVKSEECSKKMFEQLIGRETLQLIHDNMDGDSFRLEMITQTDNTGRDFHANIRGKKVSIDGIEFFLIEIRDISEKVKISKMEKELQQKMIHTNKMTAMGTLVSGVAHEINNPNNFIMFNSSLLMEFWNDVLDYIESQRSNGKSVEISGIPIEELRTDVTKLISGISNGSDRIKGIVRDLKGFAKQGMTDSFESISLEQALRTSIRILSHQIAKTTENFIVDITSPLPSIYGNTQKLEQIFINILMNALEASTGKITPIMVKCYEKDGYIHTEIIDKGIGIREEYLTRITEPFFTTKQQEGGTGLGLSIVYSIVQEHKGVLDIDSQVGSGTKVMVKIPVE
jgi:PAS domain S-box-containing protein